MTGAAAPGGARPAEARPAEARPAEARPAEARPEALFYHLTATDLDAAAPELLERCLARRWRVTVRAGREARAAALNALLWTWRDDSFLPHGGPGDGDPARQPIYLTAGRETPNAPAVLMLVDGATAEPAEFVRHARVAVVFEGRDAAAVAGARALWRVATEAGAACVYWAQSEAGRWEKRRESR